MKTGVGFGVVVCTKNKMRCLLCAVYLPKSLKSIEQHGNGVKHQENLEIAKANAILIVESTVFCRPCVADIPDGESMSQHIETDIHKTWMNGLKTLIDGEFIIPDAYLAGEGDNAYCEVCNEQILCTLENLDHHVFGHPHRIKVMAKVKPLRGIFHQNHNEDALCKICDETMENSLTKIVNHVENSHRHAQRLAKYEGLAEFHRINIMDYFDNRMEKNAFCSTCAYTVECSIPSLIEHVNTTDHCKNLYLMEIKDDEFFDEFLY